MKYRTIFVYFMTFSVLVGLWYTAIDINIDYWSYVNEKWQEVRFGPISFVGRLWMLLIALFGCFMTLASAIITIGMTWVSLVEARKEHKNWRQLELF